MRIIDPPAARSGDYVLVLRPDGIIDVRISRVWSTLDVDRFFEALHPVHTLARRRHGRVNILVRVDEVQSPVIALHVRKHALAIRQPGDRRAFVVATFLSKLQIRRLGSSDSFGLFSDIATAERWLLA